MKKYRILLYYHYTKIEDPEIFREEHLAFCIANGILGRIIVAHEGLNGTVSGTAEAMDTYMAHLRADPRFKGIDFKEDSADVHAFQKINVRVKPEIVHSSLRYLDPTARTGRHLAPDQFRQMKDDDDVVILDVRSNYEHQLGRFKNALTLDMENFREFPEKVKELKAQLEGKKVLTYCTGGIKCEKATAYLLDQGYENVYQLHGGIIKYGIEADGEDFDGKCYVFDNRLAVDVNKVNPKVVGHCHICQSASDRMVNCANPTCNAHVAICPTCGDHLEGACSEECRIHPEKRPYDGTGYYVKEKNGYDPAKLLLHTKKTKA